jgi:hypothetical protein
MEKVIFDTNGYRDLVAHKTDKQIDKIINQLKKQEAKHKIESLISPIVTKELLAHLADKSDPSFDKCLKANKALYFHSGTKKSYKMLASPELLISKAFWKKEIAANVETNKALGQMSYHLATNPSKHVFKKFQRSLNLNRDHVLGSENNFALAMLQFVRTSDPNSRGWRPFKDDDENRQKLLTSIRSESTSLDIAAGYLVIVHRLLYLSGKIKTIPTYDELYDMAVGFVKVFPEPIALYKVVMENLVNSDFNLFESSRSNFVWDIHLMFNVGSNSVDGGKLHFVTSDKAMIRTALETNARYSVWTFDEYMEFLES